LQKSYDDGIKQLATLQTLSNGRVIFDHDARDVEAKSLTVASGHKDPLIANQIGVEESLQRASVPLRGFMQKNVREKDLKLLMDLSGEAPPATPEELSLRILVPAFMISELKRAFEIGFLLFLLFLLFLPFLIIDLVVASILMSMGMMMLPRSWCPCLSS
jgi:flagellar biosynthesis protein FliP